MKLSIIYSSGTGHNLQIARWAEEEAKKLGVEVRVRKVAELNLPEELNPGQQDYQDASKDIPEATVEDVTWADALYFSTPAKFGTLTAPMKNFFEKLSGAWAEGQLINKVVTASSTAQNRNGGQEQAVLSVYTSAMHWGAIIVPPGYTDAVLFESGGNPYGVSGTVSREGFEFDIEKQIKHQTSRLIAVAKKIHE